MDKSPAFQLYPKDFLEGTAEMSNAETGAYIRLLCHQWLKEELENNKEILVRLCHGDHQGLEVALNKFVKTKNGKIVNKRLQLVKKSQKKYEKKQKKSGEKGAKKRWQNSMKDNDLNRVPIVSPLANGIAKNSSASSSSSYAKEKQASLLKEKVFELMRTRTDKAKFSDELIAAETDAFFAKYAEGNIGDLGSLVNGWLQRLKPDIQPKKMVL